MFGNLGFGQLNNLNDPFFGSVIPAYNNFTFPNTGIYSGSGVALAAAVVPGYSVNLRRGHELRVTAVPEPAAWALMILGFGAAGRALRSQRRRAIA